MSPRLIVLSGLLVSQTLPAQSPEPEEFDPDVTRWLKASPPAKTDEKKHQRFFAHANFSAREWYVHAQDGRVLANQMPAPPQEGNLPVLAQLAQQLFPMNLDPLLFTPVDEGWLGAVNRGEFGASVFWLSADEKRMTRLSNEHHVSQFIQLSSRHFAVEGLRHMGINDGSIIEFTKQPEGWKVETLVKLPSCGYAATRLSDQAMYVVTSDALLKVSLDKDVQTLISEPKLGMLFPTSVALDPGGRCVWIGMRYFVVRVNLAAKEPGMEYLLPGESSLKQLEESVKSQDLNDPFAPRPTK